MEPTVVQKYRKKYISACVSNSGQILCDTTNGWDELVAKYTLDIPQKYSTVLYRMEICLFFVCSPSKQGERSEPSDPPPPTTTPTLNLDNAKVSNTIDTLFF